MTVRRAVVTGATGFIGRRLVTALRALDVEVRVLGRDPARARATLGAGVDARPWSGEAMAPVEALAGADVVFHLAGEPVAGGRWTAERKARIRGSRVDGTRHLVDALARLEPAARPATLVSASAVGVYGDRGEALLDEASAPGEGFLADVCRGWEAEALRAATLDVRVALLRIGVVLGPGGGALAEMLPFFRRGLGGRVTLSGRQWVPWVHLDDAVGLALFAATRAELRGPLNAVAPGVVRNRDLTAALGRVLGRPALLPVPGLALRLAFGEMATVLSASQRVVPRVAQDAGYRFLYPTIDGALAAALAPPREETPWASTASSARS